MWWEVKYDVADSAGHVVDELTDEESGVRLRVSRLGAEMVSLARRKEDGSWQGVLYRDGDLSTPAQGWGNHATVMGYFLHRLWKEQSLYRGKLIKGGNHGFIRHFNFAAPEFTGEGLIYRVPADQVPPEAYPLRVGLELAYILKGGKLEVRFTFENQEEVEAHVSFGLHPGLHLTSWEQGRVLMPAGRYIRHMAPGNFLNGETVEIDFAGGEMPFAVADLPGSFLLELSGVPRRIFTVEDRGTGMRVELDFSEVPYVTIWSDGGPFICVEPCWGLPDSNPPVAFEDKIGIQKIPALGKLQRSFFIHPNLLS